jgi:hypothetical protein
MVWKFSRTAHQSDTTWLCSVGPDSRATLSSTQFVGASHRKVLVRQEWLEQYPALHPTSEMVNFPHSCRSQTHKNIIKSQAGLKPYTATPSVQGRPQVQVQVQVCFTSTTTGHAGPSALLTGLGYHGSTLASSLHGVFHMIRSRAATALADNIAILVAPNSIQLLRISVANSSNTEQHRQQVHVRSAVWISQLSMKSGGSQTTQVAHLERPKATRMSHNVARVLPGSALDWTCLNQG